MHFSNRTERTASVAWWLSLLLFAIAVLSQTAVAQAEPRDQAGTRLSWRYLVDGGALPFLWGSAALALAADTLLSPPESPLLFSADEGGETAKGDTIPDYQIALLAVGTPFLLAIPATDARLYHAKGAAEAVVTTGAATKLAKVVFGRHRPTYVDGSTDEDDRESFFSGHASITLASTTYAALYLNRHVFSRWRAEDSEFAWWETVPHAALVALSVYVPYTRISDHRHHPSDVAVGAAVGVATSVSFFLYQERRYRRGRRHAGATDVAVAPLRRGLSIVGSW